MEALTSEPIVIQLDTPNCPVAFEILNQLQLNRVPPIGDNAFGAVMLNPMPQVATQRIEIRMHADVRWCFDLAEVRKGIGVNCSGEFNSAFSAVPRKHLTNYLESRTYPRRTMTSILEENRLVHAGLLDRPVYCAAMCALFRGKYDSPKPSYLPDQIPHDPLHMVGNHTKNKAYAALAGMDKDSQDAARLEIIGCAGGDTYKDYNFADWKEVMMCYPDTLLKHITRGPPEWELSFALQVQYLQLDSFDEDMRKDPSLHAVARMYITCFVSCRLINDMVKRNIILDDEFENLYFEYMDNHAAFYYSFACFRDHTSERGEGEWARLRKVLKLFTSRKNRLAGYWEQDMREAMEEIAMDSWHHHTASRAEVHGSVMRGFNKTKPVSDYDLFIPKHLCEECAEEVRVFLENTPVVAALERKVTPDGMVFKLRDVEDWEPKIRSISGPIPSMHCEVLEDETVFSALEKKVQYVTTRTLQDTRCILWTVQLHMVAAAAPHADNCVAAPHANDCSSCSSCK